MTETTVVHVHNDFDVYIGPAAPRAEDSRCWTASVFVNPYRGRGGPRWSLAMYEELWRKRLGGPDEVYWRWRLEGLRGRRIGCWCKEKDREVPCHGDILVKLLKERADG